MFRSGVTASRLLAIRPVITKATTLGLRAPLPSSRWAAPVQARAFSFDSAKLARFNKNSNHEVGLSQQQTSAPTERENVSEYDALTPYARKYLVRVYANSAAGVVSIAAGASLMLFTPLSLSVPFWAPMVASFVPLIGLNFTRSQGARLAMFHSFAGLVGMGVAPVILFAKMGGVLAPALGLTGATFAGFTSAAMLAPRGSSVKMQGPLMAGLFGLIGMQLFSLFYPTALATQLSMYGGLALFSLFVAADTGAMIERANTGSEDIVGDSINVVLNCVNIFTRMVQILSGRND